MYEERMIFGMKLGKRIVSLLVSTAIAITSLIPINLMAFAADPNYQYYNDLQYPDAGAVNLEKTGSRNGKPVGYPTESTGQEYALKTNRCGFGD